MDTSIDAHGVGPGALASTLRGLAAPPVFVPLAPTHDGLEYRPGRDAFRRADVYLPAGPGPHPSLVLVHGGGFVIGSRSMKPMRFLATRLCQAGYAVATFDYRLLLRGGRDLADPVDDVRAMLRWWGAAAGRFSLDPARIAAAGLSAGGTLLLLACSGQPPIPLAAVVSVFALYDLAGLRGRLTDLLGRLACGTSDRAEWSRRSPAGQPHCAAPMTLLHGTADGLTPVAQALRYAAARTALGLPTRVHLYEGAPHGFFNDAGDPVCGRALSDVIAALPR